ncbi:choice-of-anchor L domain-containing protein [uncultured Mesonia sp.]|uniref:T9SS type B sorting domain-containing protein n=1 Tax=uncultured Mesonia sp. TaxID=399731 RepID=UPI00374EF6EC
MKYAVLVVFLIFNIGFSQNVQVDVNTYNAQDLSEMLLNNACSSLFNAEMSSSQAVGYFSQNNSNFPIEEGVIIRSGNAKHSEGPFSGNHLSSQINQNTNAYLENLNAASGQHAQITDVAFLSFEFVPLSHDFSFNFVFASNEYGQWQCVSSDVFAFVLTNLNTGQSQNLAVIPGTTTPVSVKNIKDKAYNNSCSSDNKHLFGEYLVNQPNAGLNMRGYTKVMKASAQIVPGDTYKIELLIADSNDANFDSAIFLEAGSFQTNVNLGDDEAICLGQSKTLTTGLDTQLYNHTWKMNGSVVNYTNTNTLTVTNPGDYSVEVTENNTGCLLTDEIQLTQVQINEANNLKICYDDRANYFWDLTVNNHQILGVSPSDYELFYYASLQDLNSDLPIPAANITAFAGTPNQSVYIKLKAKNNNNWCTQIIDFKLEVADKIHLGPLEDIQLCDITKTHLVDLTQVNEDLVGHTQNYMFAYYYSQADLEAGQNEIQDYRAFSVSPSRRSNNQNIYVKVTDRYMPECYVFTSFQIQVNGLPLVDELPDVIECSTYTLPPLTHGNYFTRAQGGGTPLFAGDVIDESGTYYIYNGPTDAGCYNQSSFTVQLIEEYGIKDEYCEFMRVPSPPAGNFYTLPGGPSGGGKIIPPGTIYYNDASIYYYAEVNGVFCKEDTFSFQVFPLPPVDQPADVITCNNYTLPALTHGNYYTQSGGAGDQLLPGTTITETTTLYAFNFDGRCANQSEFTVFITPQFDDVVSCGAFQLPEVEVGGFYSLPNGQGNLLTSTTKIKFSQTIYYFAETTTSPNCTTNLSFEVTIFDKPKVDTLPNVVQCASTPFVLPPLQDGEYFTEKKRGGQMLAPGDVIAESQTIFINNATTTCMSETSFTVTLIPLPVVPNFADVYTCDTYELPEITGAKYFSGPNGSGNEYFSGDLIHSTQKLFLYKESSSLVGCDNEDSFTVYVEGVEATQLPDVLACETFVLPQLAVGEYFTEPYAKGQKLQPGTEIKESKTVYIFAQKGDRFTCFDQTSFRIEVEPKIDLSAFEHYTHCGELYLPDLAQENQDFRFFVDPNFSKPVSPNALRLTKPGKYIFYVQASSNLMDGCISEGRFEIEIFPIKQLNLEPAAICLDPETGELLSTAFLETGLDPNKYNVYWYLENQLVHEGVNFEVTQAGTFEIEVELKEISHVEDCGYYATSVQVYASSRPEIKVNVSEPFSGGAEVFVELIKAEGEMMYQIDDQPYQESPYFTGVGSGPHLVRAKGKYADCGEVVKEIQVINYPKFFTPNTDGINDYWNINDMYDYPEAKIYIYDRFGKLITSTNPRKRGWDGSFNGKQMPSADYWFQVEYKYQGNIKVFKSHFTLKR